MTYYASSSTDGLNNTNWSFSATGGFYFAYNSVDAGNNTGWLFQAVVPTSTVIKQAARDQNGRTTLLGTSGDSNVAGTLKVVANPTTHGIYVADGTTGNNYGYADADRDDNYIPVILAVSSADGTTPVPIYVDGTTGSLFINSN